MKNVFKEFEQKDVKNVWAISGGDGQVDGEDSKNDDRGDAQG